MHSVAFTVLCFPQEFCIIPLENSNALTSTLFMWSVQIPPAVALDSTALHGITRYLNEYILNPELLKVQYMLNHVQYLLITEFLLKACTEIEMCYESNNVTDMFPPMKFTEQQREQYCVKRWGVVPRPGWLKTQYWGNGT